MNTKEYKKQPRRSEEIKKEELSDSEKKEIKTLKEKIKIDDRGFIWL
ncbi:hypothetical protein HYT92_00455 [Candidatus Pacearchaeota archaeon]|nr:hypothetical protein [Candidatus Pacearchaeota archaeon]